MIGRYVTGVSFPAVVLKQGTLRNRSHRSLLYETFGFVFPEERYESKSGHLEQIIGDCVVG